jgi:RNA polymerase sigma-70 factor, ECF subfamily
MDLIRREWISLSQQGDSEAYGKLVFSTYGRIVALCHCKLGCLADAEDAAQEVFIKAWRSLDALADVDRFDGWIRSIALRVCIDQLRVRTRTTNSERLSEWPESASELDKVEAADERQQLMSIVRDLDEPLAEVLLLFYFESMSYDEMAKWIGVARATVQERLSKARQKVKHQLLLLRRTHYEL